MGNDSGSTMAHPGAHFRHLRLLAIAFRCYLFSATLLAASPFREPLTWLDPKPQGGSILRTVYGNGLFVGVGSGGVIVTSSDGRSWAVTHADTLYSLQDVVWTGTQFVAVGGWATVATSPDGLHWTTRDLGLDDYFTAVAYGDGLYVVTCYCKGYVYVSRDALTWTTASVPDAWCLKAAGFGAGRYVVAGKGGDLFTSIDGYTWNRVTQYNPPPIQWDTYNFVRWLNGQFFVGGETGQLLTSKDGVTWATIWRGENTRLTDVVFTGSLYVMTAIDVLDPYGFIEVSKDASSWTRVYTPIHDWLNTVAWSGSCLVAMGWSRILRSDDGYCWMRMSEGGGETVNHWPQVMACDGKNCVYLGAEGYAASTVNGSIWTLRETGISDELSCIAFADGHFVSMGHLGHCIASVDGVRWQLKSQAFIQAEPRGLAFGNGTWVVLNQAQLTTSQDLVNWHYNSLTSLWNNFRGIAFGNSVFVVVGMRDPIFSSADGLSWTPANVEVPFDLLGVIWDGMRFVAIGSPNGIGISTDGLVWSFQALDPGWSPFRQIGFANGTYFAICDDGFWAASKDLVHWSFFYPLAGAYQGNSQIAYDGSQYLLTGPGGVMGACDSLTVRPSVAASETSMAMTFKAETGCAAGPLVYRWDFGDGSSPSSEPNPTHVYSAGGSYAASIEVFDGTTSQHDSRRVEVRLPPFVTKMTSTAPTTITVKGANLQQGLTVKINGEDPLRVIWKNPQKVILQDGSGLVRKKIQTHFTFINPDGGTLDIPWRKG
jgi:hypothetical protein